jgi:hypothetical protein
MLAKQIDGNKLGFVTTQKQGKRKTEEFLKTPFNKSLKKSPVSHVSASLPRSRPSLIITPTC